jgi:Na+-driven multidrug efflux pump
MMQGLLQSLYNSADLVVVGRFAGELALSSVGATGSAYAVLVNLFIGAIEPARFSSSVNLSHYHTFFKK